MNKTWAIYWLFHFIGLLGLPAGAFICLEWMTGHATIGGILAGLWIGAWMLAARLYVIKHGFGG